jgi:hypothetical protein
LEPGLEIDMRKPKMIYVWPFVVSLTMAPEGCLSLTLLTQSTIAVTKMLMRLKGNRSGSVLGSRAS